MVSRVTHPGHSSATSLTPWTSTISWTRTLLLSPRWIAGHRCAGLRHRLRGVQSLRLLRRLRVAFWLVHCALGRALHDVRKRPWSHKGRGEVEMAMARSSLCFSAQQRAGASPRCKVVRREGLLQLLPLKCLLMFSRPNADVPPSCRCVFSPAPRDVRRSILGEARCDTPMVVPGRCYLDVIRRMMIAWLQAEKPSEESLLQRLQSLSFWS